MKHVPLKYLVEPRSGGRPEFAEDGRYIAFGAGAPLGATTVPNAQPGDILIGRVGTVGSVRLLERPAWATDNTIVLRSRSSSVVPKYLSRCLEVSNLAGFASTTAQPLLTFERIRDHLIFCPPRDTQRAIADYLDRETGEIDAMIAKMDELAETLDLRRAEAVSSAISGLGRNDRIATANTWFPDIPQGWKLTSVQLLSELLTDGAHVSPETENGEFDFVSTKDVRNGIIDFAGSLKTSARSYASMVQTGCKPLDGDVLYSKDGTIGETVLVYGSHDFVVASSLIIIRPRRDLVAPRYLQYALESTPARKAARSYTRGTGLPRISVANLGRGVTVPLPPTLDEQHRIADHLDEVTGKIDAMQAKVAELKSLLIERRAALITDVVTGRKAVA